MRVGSFTKKKEEMVRDKKGISVSGVVVVCVGTGRS